MMISSVKKPFINCEQHSNISVVLIFPGLNVEWLLSLSVKRKPDSRAPSKQKNRVLSASTASTDLPSSSNPSLDVLKHMIHEVEHEIEEYERWTGRKVQGLQNSQGLTGFTLSLVSSLCRLVRYLKEVRLLESTLLLDWWQSWVGFSPLHLNYCILQIKCSQIWVTLFKMAQLWIICWKGFILLIFSISW